MSQAKDRDQTRAVFFRAWRAHREGKPLEGAEKLIVHVALRHPEYHALLEQPEAARERDYPAGSGESNPFLHLGLHIAIEEQLALDQPRGILAVYRDLLRALPDEHAVQHRMMECLNETLWRAQQNASPPEDAIYLDCLTRLTKSPRASGH